MNFKKILTNIFFIIGLILILFPILSKILSSLNQTTIINNYNEQISKMGKNEVLSFKESAVQYNNNLYEEKLFDTSLTQDNISNIDFLGTNILAYITIPKINIELPIYEGSTDNVLSIGIGHLSNTSLPVGGPNTHCVLVRSYWSCKFCFI